MTQNNEKMQTPGTRISNFIIGAMMFSISMIIWMGGKQLYGSDATLLWASGIITFLALYPIIDSFRRIHK